MKTYNITVIIDENGVGVREKSEGMTINEIRQVISVLEEYKLRLIQAVVQRQQEFDLKNQTKQ